MSRKTVQDLRLLAIDVIQKSPEHRYRVEEIMKATTNWSPQKNISGSIAFQWLEELKNMSILPMAFAYEPNNTEVRIIKSVRDSSSGRHKGMDTPSYSDKTNSPTSLHWELYNFIIPKLPQTTTVGRAKDIIAHLEEDLRKEWVAWKISKMKVKK